MKKRRIHRALLLAGVLTVFSGNFAAGGGRDRKGRGDL